MRNPLAIEALAHGFIDGGGEIFTNFPGFMSHQLFSALGGTVTSVNEKVAYEVAWGASFGGKRSVTTFKNVGLNDAADPFLNSMLVGVNAGLVLVVFDDVHIKGSQSRQDSRHYFDFFRGLWFEPYFLQNTYDIAYQSFSLSEQFRLPIVLRITNQLLYQKGEYKRRQRIKKCQSLFYDHRRFVIHPVNAKFQREALRRKNLAIQDFIDSCYQDERFELKRQNALFVFGCCAAEEKKYQSHKYQKIQLYTYPIPKKLKEVMASAKSTVVLEQGDEFAYEKIVALSSNKEPIKSNSGVIPDKSSGYIISDNYKKLFLAIKRIHPSFVVGDLGEYTQDTLDTIDACLCFGSSISVGMGGILAGARPVISIIGDAAYLHSGKNIIPEAIKRRIPVKAIVICNGGSQGTGGQEIPGDLFYQPKGVEKYILDYKKAKIIDFEKILSKIIKDNRVSVLYVLM